MMVIHTQPSPPWRGKCSTGLLLGAGGPVGVRHGCRPVTSVACVYWGHASPVSHLATHDLYALTGWRGIAAGQCSGQPSRGYDVFHFTCEQN